MFEREGLTIVGWIARGGFKKASITPMYECTYMYVYSYLTCACMVLLLLMH